MKNEGKKVLALFSGVQRNKNYKVLLKFKHGQATYVNLEPFSLSKLLSAYYEEKDKLLGDPIVTLPKWGGGVIVIKMGTVQHIEFEEHRGLSGTPITDDMWKKYTDFEESPYWCEKI